MLRLGIGLVIGLSLVACGESRDGSGTDEAADAAAVMEVFARGLTFEGPDAVSAGWTTIRFTNESPMAFEFVGGLNEMPAGSTGYFTVTPTAGEDALVSEVPGTRAEGLLQTFSVN